MVNERWYPTVEEAGGHAQHNVHRQVLDLIYGMQDKLDAQQKGGSAAQAPSASPSTGPGSSSHTTIAGIAVKAVQPQNGQVLKYNSSTGQIEWS